MWKPKPYRVFSELTQGRHKGHRHLVGTGETVEDCRAVIKEDIRALARPDTIGGLIDWGPMEPRKYLIFHAEWTQVE